MVIAGGAGMPALDNFEALAIISDSEADVTAFGCIHVFFQAA
jgi:hypothetical protein